MEFVKERSGASCTVREFRSNNCTLKVFTDSELFGPEGKSFFVASHDDSIHAPAIHIMENGEMWLSFLPKEERIENLHQVIDILYDIKNFYEDFKRSNLS